MLDVEVFVLVVVAVLPLSYVVAPPVYAPEIFVFDPLEFVCVTENAVLVIKTIHIITNKVYATGLTILISSVYSL